ncbi:MAG: hypothetical protein UT34_C0001G0493 [candidate division WS6 bacterium GW2011_GWF2_39_15]|uniref:Uncharacterized protein n=1 Tax=candidate division WS6 bacterium GW2011_GWF2_39_15 TaxID=1619100 RepID=A0A0G0QXS7_9BACT|nr:MAG: hypothetical protein UT34_C0001G0493 [candidate division WS6 bacterium GW2011_GWF2_39_15]
MKINEIKKYVEKKGGLFASWFGISNPFGSDSFTTVEGTVGKVQTVVNTAVNLSALVLVGLLVYGGILMITAAGDPDKIDQSQKIITNAIVGMIIIFVAKMIIIFVLTEVLKV